MQINIETNDALIQRRVVSYDNASVLRKDAIETFFDCLLGLGYGLGKFNSGTLADKIEKSIKESLEPCRFD